MHTTTLNTIGEMMDPATMSYTDFFAFRFGAKTPPPTVKPLQARRDFFRRRNTHPLHKNMLYIHIPFCASRCRYCPYFSHLHSARALEDYLEALEREIRLVSDTPYVTSTEFECVYVGGGTPSLLNLGNLEQLAGLIRENFTLAKNAEVTLEANPATLTEDKIRALHPLGFNRVSLGVQSFDETILRSMRCAHTPDRARQVIDLLRAEEMVLNFDIMFGFVGQTWAQCAADLEALEHCGWPEQLTLFPLRIAQGTPMSEEWAQTGSWEVIAHNRQLLEFDATAGEYLEERGYLREGAPIMYHRKDSRPHRYQSVTGRILGLGAGAGSVLDGVESINHREVSRYVTDLQRNQLPVAHDAWVTEPQIRERFVLFNILFLDRSRPEFQSLVAARFEEYFQKPIGSTYQKVVSDLVRHGYIQLIDDLPVFTEGFWKVLAGLRIGTPSIRESPAAMAEQPAA